MTEGNKETAIVRVGEQRPAVVQDPKTVIAVAEQLFKSGMFPNVRSAAGAYAVIECGLELGIPPVASLNTIDIINGRLTLEAKALLALANNRAGVTWEVEERSDKKCKMIFKRPGFSKSIVSEFTIEEAKEAGLLTKQNWKSWVPDMLFARCASRGVRMIAPDSVLGLYSKEEMVDVPVLENTRATIPAPVTDATPEVDSEVLDVVPEDVPARDTTKITLTDGTMKEVNDKTMLPYFASVKKQLNKITGNDDTYYNILSQFGHNKSNEIRIDEASAVWEIMKQAYLELKEARAKADEAKLF